MENNNFDKTIYHGVDRQTMQAWLRNQCSPMKGRHGYLIGPDVNGRFCHYATYFTLGEAVRKAKDLNQRNFERGDVFESSTNPEYSVTVFSDHSYGLRGAGYFMHPTGDQDTSLSAEEMGIRGVCPQTIEELKAIGSYATWGK